MTDDQTLSRRAKCKERCHYLFTSMSRRRPVEPQGEKVFTQVLGLFDLTLFGIGCTLGVGVYIIAGKEAHDKAGPAVIVSLVFAGVASILAGLTYAELASRVETSGSAYVYSYVVCGEFPAYVIGWNLLLEYAIGTASVARAALLYVDGLAGQIVTAYLENNVPLHIEFFGPYLDIPSFIVVTLVNLLLALGTKTSSVLTNIMVAINIMNILIMSVGAFMLADPHNWDLKESEVPSDAGQGGFMPYGMDGVLRATSTCFFAYVGFDSIAATGEESKNPRRNIPLSIFFTLAAVGTTYILVASAITLAVPYYAQDVNTPFPTAFGNEDWTAMQWIVGVGAITALLTSLVGAAYPLPRVLYSMASDGLFFRYFSSVNEKFKTPLWAIFLSWIVTSVMVLLFDLGQLMDMMSIGTLMAYIVVGFSVVQIRYRCLNVDALAESTPDAKGWNCKRIFSALFNVAKAKKPTKLSNAVVTISQIIILFFDFLLFSIIGWVSQLLYPPVLLAVVFSALVVIFLIIVVGFQPTNEIAPKIFAVPLSPYLPYASILVNTYFMITIDPHTWVRFIIWNTIGLLIYFLYGIKHSGMALTNTTGEANPGGSQPKKT